ncbi:MAG: A/G-specific adenine glycosylase, partial [bacterium]
MAGKFPVENVENWFDENRRDLPWRKTDDPYKIWVAEVMLQQTQVKTVLKYYDDFLDQFPSVEDLAAASQDEVLKAWEGMGFYARARRLHSAAQNVIDEYDGTLPRSEEHLRSLPGIGEYTAAAIGAFAFGQNSPVLDSNV